LETSKASFQILSLDGGGIKGLFSAALLAHIEKDFNIKICDHFDLITGTSTGGIIALGLGKGLAPKEIVEFYVQEGPKIFPQAFWRHLTHYVTTKFRGDQLEKSLQSCLGDSLLGDSTKRLVIPSYSTSEDDIYLFKTPHHPRLRRDWKVPMWQVAMATTAAPTYFPSFNKIEHARLIDGGVWANNPSMVGIIEAQSLLNAPLSTLKIFNIGTTDPIKGRSPKLDSGGKWHWKSEASDVILKGQSKGAYTQASLLLGTDNVIRLDPPVPDGLFRLDKISVAELMGKAAHFSRQISPVIERTFLAHKAAPYTPEYGTKE